MDLVNILHMNAGHHKYSYANSSTLQKNAILKSTKVLEDTIENYGSHGFSERFKVADLGCSCGPNPFLLITTIINSIDAVCQKNNIEAPDEFQVFLNDLPSNDFNTLFKMIPEFYSKLENHEKNTHGRSAKCFIFGAPGSFYTRLFPSKSLHFVHSSYAVHWLSRVPKMLLNNNKRHIYIAKGSPPCVYEAYLNQYKRDFATFLRMRSQEIICDGRMVLSFLGRSIADPTSKDCSFIYELLAKSLGDMLAEGLLHEEDINSFNLPIYTPCTDELKAIIESESSFSIDRLETFEVDWDMRNEDEIVKSKDNSGEFVAKTTRAVMEPLFVSHFRIDTIVVDQIFQRFARRVNEHLSTEETSYFNIVVSLTRK